MNFDNLFRKDCKKGRYKMARSGLSGELQRFRDAFEGIPFEMHKHVVGADEFIKMLILTLLAGSGKRADEQSKEYHTHLLTESDVGEGKTEICKTFAATLSMSFNRIQFERDLKPRSLKETREELENRMIAIFDGPLNAHVVLADELTRSGDAVHTAMLEAMAEGVIILPNVIKRTPRPYMILATANPMDLRGVSRPGRALSDRFTFRIDTPKYTSDERIEIARGQEKRARERIQKVASPDDVLSARDLIFEEIFISDEIMQTMERLTGRFRTEYLFYGEEGFGKHGASGERPFIYFVRTAKARAFMEQRMYVTLEDIAELAYPLLRHRIDLGFGVRGVEKRKRIEQVVREVLRETAGIDYSNSPT